MKWLPDWDRVKGHHVKWWQRDGLVLYLTAPRDEPIEAVPEPAPPPDLRTRWLDPVYRRQDAEHRLAHTFYAADAFPILLPMIGPGSLGTFLGAEPHFMPTTVWYEACVTDPESYGPIRFEPNGNRWLDAHLALIDEALAHADGRYCVGMPDLIENIDTLAAMRGNEAILLDLVTRPEWVKRSIDQINEAFFASFDLLDDRLRDADGGNGFVFNIWGPGKTAKVQCDFACMISPAMFEAFVVPALSAQCDWLDYSLFHLDGTNAMQHLDALLAIEGLNAIEWTPQAGRPQGGSPVWYDLYRRIRAGGKGVQAVGVKHDEVIPLIEAVGPRGLYIMAAAPDPATAEALAAQVEQYR